MKIFFISSSLYILYLMKVQYRPTHDPAIDTIRLEYLVGPAAVAALILNYGFNLLEVSWAFSIYLEAVAILPQLFMLQRTGEAETITTHYIFALGAYRALYIPNWIYRYFADNVVDPISVLAGLVQTGLYLDFFHSELPNLALMPCKDCQIDSPADGYSHTQLTSHAETSLLHQGDAREEIRAARVEQQYRRGIERNVGEGVRASAWMQQGGSVETIERVEGRADASRSGGGETKARRGRRRPARRRIDGMLIGEGCGLRQRMPGGRKTEASLPRPLRSRMHRTCSAAAFTRFCIPGIPAVFRWLRSALFLHSSALLRSPSGSAPVKARICTRRSILQAYTRTCTHTRITPPTTMIVLSIQLLAAQ